MATERKPRDLAGTIMAVLFIGLGAWILMQAQDLSPLGSVFPRTIAIALIVFSLVLIGINLWRGRTAEEDDPAPADPITGEPPPATEPPAGAESTPRRLSLVAIMVGWSLLLPVIGFFVSSVVAFVALLLVAEYERWTLRRAAIFAAVALVLVTGFYFLLRDVLLIPLPRGLLF